MNGNFLYMNEKLCSTNRPLPSKAVTKWKPGLSILNKSIAAALSVAKCITIVAINLVTHCYIT